MAYIEDKNNQVSFLLDDFLVNEEAKSVKPTNKRRRKQNKKNLDYTQTLFDLESINLIEQGFVKKSTNYNELDNNKIIELLNEEKSTSISEIINELKLDKLNLLFSEIDDTLMIKIIKTDEIKYLYKQEAMEKLYSKYEYLYGYAIYKAKLHIRADEDTEYKQHGHYLMSKAIASFDDSKGCSFKSFLYCVLYRGYISKYFQTDKYKFSEVPIIPIVEDDDIASFDMLLSDNIEEQSYISLETDELLDELQDSLTDIEYQCLMARISGLAYKDIAELTGLSIKQVDNRIQRIRKNKLAGL